MIKDAKGRIAVICGAKGGMGVTCVAVNLAAAISISNEVALLSLNRDSAEDLSSWFGCSALQDSRDFMELAQTGTPELLSSVCEKLGERLFLIRPGLREQIPNPDEIDGFIGLLRRRFNWVVVDGGTVPLDRHEGMLDKLMSFSAVGIVVFTPDPVAIKRMPQIGRQFRNSGKKIVAVQNRAASGGAPSGMRDWERLLGGIDLLATIGEARGMREAILRAAPIPLADGGSDAASEFLYLAKLLERFQQESEVKAAAAGEGDSFRSSAYRDLRRKLHRRLLERMRERGVGSYEQDRDALRDELIWLMEEENLAAITPGFRERLLEELMDAVTGLGPLQDLVDDPEISEIMVNGSEGIYIERKGRISRVERALDDEEEIRGLIERIIAPLGRRIDESSPLVDARLPDGSRVNAIIPPLALGGPCLTIRKFGERLLSIEDLLQRGSLTAAAAEFLRACVACRLNILISGGTGSGKTTLLNVMGSFLSPDERIITIEDAAELRLPQKHVIRLEARPANLEGRGAVTIRDLLRNALRMRPDRIVIGECRGGEALDMLQAMNTGHEGSISTLHANSPRDALARLETMVLMAGMELPLRAIREQLYMAVDIIVQVARMKDGGRRIAQITEVEGLERDAYRLQDIFLRRGEGPLEHCGLVPKVAEKMRERGWELPQGIFG